MTTTLVDTNVLLDVFTSDPVWADWSLEELDAAAMVGPLFINDVVQKTMRSSMRRIDKPENGLDKESVRSPAEQAAIDRWLRLEVVPVPKPMGADPSSGIPIKQVFDEIRDLHRARRGP